MNSPARFKPLLPSVYYRNQRARLVWAEEVLFACATLSTLIRIRPVSPDSPGLHLAGCHQPWPSHDYSHQKLAGHWPHNTESEYSLLSLPQVGYFNKNLQTATFKLLGPRLAIHTALSSPPSNHQSFSLVLWYWIIPINLLFFSI